MMERVYIGLGSNLAKPLQQLRAALQAIAQLPHSQLQAHSSFYISDPLGPADQPRYVNAVAALDTALEPWQLLDALQTPDPSRSPAFPRIPYLQSRIPEFFQWLQKISVSVKTPVRAWCAA